MDLPMQSAHDILDAQSIRAALERNSYNRLAAARDLGIHKTTLFRKMKKLQIPLPEPDGRTRTAQTNL
jgi:transcriptional regulator with PAS, ATPase and Fis domain